MSPLSTRTAVILDDHPLWLDALQGLLQRLEIEVVARATQATDLQALTEEHRPDLLMVDYGAVAHSLSTLLQARSACLDAKCIVLSDSDDADERERSFAAGADVFCLKRAEPDDLAAAIRQAFEHSIYFATAVSARSSDPVTIDGPVSAAAGLTKRELEILRLAAEGYSNSQLARMLWVTEQTVKFHLSNIYRKLGVANRTEASRWAQRNNLLTVTTAA